MVSPKIRSHWDVAGCLVLASSLTGCGWGDYLASSNAKFTLEQGAEYCKRIPMPHWTYPGQEPILFPMGANVFHINPERPDVLLATNLGQTGSEELCETCSTNTLVIDFRTKTVTTIPTVRSNWKLWRRVPSDLGGGALRPDLFFRFGDPKLDAKEEEIRTLRPSGKYLSSAIYSPSKKFVEVWSGNEKPRPAPQGTGESYMEIFRVSDGKRLVKVRYDRQRMMYSTVECCSVSPSDNEYFLPIDPNGATGLICQFPPETFR